MIKYRIYGKLNLNSVQEDFNTICKTTSKLLKLNENLEFDVNIVGVKKIHLINKKYRKIDKPTDVISFAYRDSNEIQIPLLGEIFICLDVAKKQAKEYKHSLRRELVFLFTHGLLHLLGYDHMNKKDEKVMFSLTDKIIKNSKCDK